MGKIYFNRYRPADTWEQLGLIGDTLCSPTMRLLPNKRLDIPNTCVGLPLSDGYCSGVQYAQPRRRCYTYR